MDSKTLRTLIDGLGNSKYIIVEKFPGYNNHRIGFEPESRCIVLLISNQNPNKVVYPSDRGVHLDIIYDAECSIKSGGHVSKNRAYTVLKLKSKDLEIERYFLELSIILVKSLGAKPSMEKTREEVLRIESIFRKLSKVSTKDVTGLWGELLMIELTNKPEKMITAWHSSANAKLDFNDGESKIEVKTSSKLKRRLHFFELNQLWKYKGSVTLIVSILTEEIDNGKSISDLIESIKTKVNVKYYQLLIEKVFEVVGDNLQEFSEVRFDYEMGKSQMKFFDANRIPRPTGIPTEVTQVKFRVDLTGFEAIKKSKLKGDLFKSIL